MKKTLSIAALVLFFLAGQSACIFAQEPTSESQVQSSSAKTAAKSAGSKPTSKPAPKAEFSITQHTARIDGQTIHWFWKFV